MSEGEGEPVKYHPDRHIVHFGNAHILGYVKPTSPIELPKDAS